MSSPRISPAQRRTLHAVAHNQPAPGPRDQVLKSVGALHRKGLLNADGKATASGLNVFRPNGSVQHSIGGAG